MSFGLPVLIPSTVSDHLWGQQSQTKPAQLAPHESFGEPVAFWIRVVRDVEMEGCPDAQGYGDDTG
jgi:hypothetical protein